MLKPAMLAYAAHFASRFAPRLLQVKRRTWIGLGLGLLVLLGLLLWAFFALAVWLLGLIFNGAGDLRQAAEGPYRAAVEQVEAVVPAVVAPLRSALEPWLPQAAPTPAAPTPAAPTPATSTRDVSGQELGPVPRYPGMVRSQWFQDESLARVQYQGAVDYTEVVRHYVDGFAARGFAQVIQAASPGHEIHRFSQGPASYRVEIRRESDTRVSTSIEGPAS